MKNPKTAFAHKFFDHEEWEEKPVAFKLGGKERFEPDFYDRKRGVYIHLITSRERYRQLKPKVNRVREMMGCTIEFRQIDGSLIDEGGRVSWIKQL